MWEALRPPQWVEIKLSSGERSFPRCVFDVGESSEKLQDLSCLTLAF